MLDSIGIETGDSCYVLGSIVDAEVSPSGSILLLDQSACCIREFSSEGTYLANLSRHGNGPGEFLFPQEMALHPDGRIIVMDMFKHSLIIIDSNGENLSELEGWPLLPPCAIVPVDTSCFAGCSIDFDMPGVDLSLIFKPSFYSMDSIDRELVFYSDTLIVENALEAPLTPTGMLGYAIMTSDNRNGRVYYANMSTHHHEIRCWDSNGNLLFSFSLGITPVAKTSQELQEETEYERIQFAALGMGTLPENYEPDPFHSFIVGLGVDDNGNLWIQRGTEEKPVFDIISNDGVHIATVEFPRNGHHWKFSITPYGSLAWNLDPESGVQRVYTLELPHMNSND